MNVLVLILIFKREWNAYHKSDSAEEEDDEVHKSLKSCSSEKKLSSGALLDSVLNTPSNSASVPVSLLDDVSLELSLLLLLLILLLLLELDAIVTLPSAKKRKLEKMARCRSHSHRNPFLTTISYLQINKRSKKKEGEKRQTSNWMRKVEEFIFFFIQINCTPFIHIKATTTTTTECCKMIWQSSSIASACELQ